MLTQQDSTPSSTSTTTAKMQLDLALSRIKGANEILQKINKYLETCNNVLKKSNATKTKDSLVTLLIDALLKQPELDGDIYQRISTILDTWEESDKKLAESYWIGEVSSLSKWLPGASNVVPESNRTLIAIKESREIIKTYDPASIKPLLHAFPNANATIEQLLLQLLEKQDFAAFEKLINQNLNGFNVDAVDTKDNNQKTLLHRAAVNSDPNFLKLLLQKGSDPNIRDKNGWTPVHCAAYGGKIDHITLFINNQNKSVDWAAKTTSGQTIRELAILGRVILGKTNSDRPNSNYVTVIEMIQKMELELTNHENHLSQKLN